MQSHDAISVGAVCRAAQQVQTIEEAEDRLGVKDLPSLLADRALGEAWKRGRLLRHLAELAASPLCSEAVSKALGMTEQAFRKLLRADIVVREIWETGRQTVLVAAKSAIMSAAQRGEAYAVRAMQRLLQGQMGDPAASGKTDFGQLTLEQLCRATGIARQQLLRWRDNHGMPQESNGYYSLPKIINWLRKADVGKVRGYRRKLGAVQKRIMLRIEQIVEQESGSCVEGETTCSASEK